MCIYLLSVTWVDQCMLYIVTISNMGRPVYVYIFTISNMGRPVYVYIVTISNMGRPVYVVYSYYQ